MSQYRLRKKLENFLATYNTPGITPGDAKFLLGKIHKIEKQLGLPLTDLHKNTNHIKFEQKKIYETKIKAEVQEEKLKEITLQEVEKQDLDYSEIYLKRYRYNKKIEKVIDSLLTEEEKEYKRKYDEWFKGKQEEAKKKIKDANLYPFIERSVNRKINVLEMIELLNEGWNYKQLSSKYGCTPEAISISAIKYLSYTHHAVGLATFERNRYRGGKERWNGLTPEKLAKYLNDGVQAKEIAGIFGISQSHVTSMRKVHIAKAYRLKDEIKILTKKDD